MTHPLPVGATKPLKIALGDIDTRLLSDVKLDGSSNVDVQPPVRHNLTTFTIPALVVQNGGPLADSGIGARLGSKAGVGAFTKVTEPLAVKTLKMGAFARWVPYREYLGAISNGSRYWWPQGWLHSTTASPRISLKTFTGTGIGEGPYSNKAPQIDADYEYQGFLRKMKLPAMVFDGTGHAGIDLGLVDTWRDFTMAMVAVMRPTTEDQFGLFESQRLVRSTLITDPMDIRYTHGRVDLHHEGERLMAHQTMKPAQYPLIVIFSFDGTDNMIRVYFLDKNRTTRTYSRPTLDSIMWRGTIGALGQGTLRHPIRNPAEMDLLEIDVWRYAMEYSEMEAKANLLSLAYGVAG